MLAVKKVAFSGCNLLYLTILMLINGWIKNPEWWNVERVHFADSWRFGTFFWRSLSENVCLMKQRIRRQVFKRANKIRNYWRELPCFPFCKEEPTPNGYLYRLKRFAICIWMHHSDTSARFLWLFESNCCFTIYFNKWARVRIQSEACYKIYLFFSFLKATKMK